jgi:hypothetical protein
MEEIVIKKGEWVQIHKIILEPSERAPQAPEDTRSVPLEMWVKGHLSAEAEIGGPAEIVTRTGRLEQGTLVEVNPTYRHSFGNFMPELLAIDDRVRGILFGGEDK